MKQSRLKAIQEEIAKISILNDFIGSDPISLILVDRNIDRLNELENELQDTICKMEKPDLKLIIGGVK